MNLISLNTERHRTGSSAKKSAVRLDIQGLRAVAVLLVVLYHANVPFIAGGYIGVDIFLVISGFLITTHLLGSIVDEGRISLIGFYAKRMKRLLPAAFLVIVATLAAALAVLPPVRVMDVTRDAAAAVLYVPNLWLAYKGTDYLTEDFPSPFRQFWSLGLEEQFYLIWPILLVAMWKIFGRTLKSLTAGLVVLILASLLASIVLTPTYGPFSFFTLPTRMWEFGFGGLAAVLVYSKGHASISRGLKAQILGWTGLGLVLVSATIYDSSVLFPGFAAIMPVLGATLLVIYSNDWTVAGPGHVLKLRPFTVLGDWSYSIYLWHWPLLIIPLALWPDMGLGLTLLLAAVSLPLAYATYRFVENPARRSVSLSSMRPRLLVGLGATLSIVIAAGSVFAGIGLNKREIASDRNATDISLVSSPTFTDFVPANGMPSLQNANYDLPAPSSDNCSPGTYESDPVLCNYGVTESDSVIVLFGDSHAAQWFSAVEKLAVSVKARLVVITKPGCASIDIPRFEQGKIDPFCAEWQSKAVEKINSLNPELIFLSNLHHRAKPNGSLFTSAEWSQGTTRSMAAFEEPEKVVVIADTPWFDLSPIQCLSLNVDDTRPCAELRKDVVDESWIQAEKSAVGNAGGNYLNMTEYYCNAVHCNAYIGNVLLYRDAHHLSDTYVSSLSDEFEDEVSKLNLRLPLSE
ncbi:acyltransferase family protein [Arthrobacter sp. Marseille-P9274]|uniref:acyltransferase family protein n=1 Tax=Arthrobacter sp. Marseille-P9274 TaxID=2866572 RepID=UPI0021C8BD73|nr:acyltransferase family protein [Arthrobacter sp. Marseille-P9274]